MLKEDLSYAKHLAVDEAGRVLVQAGAAGAVTAPGSGANEPVKPPHTRDLQTLVEHHEERWWAAEVCRLRGISLLQQPEIPQAEAETWLQQALDVARYQEAKLLELRAAMSLSRLWQQGKPAEAREVLAPIYGWFTKGFDTADLEEAKALLEELSQERSPRSMQR